MDRRTYIEGIGTVVAAGAVAGCTGNGNGATDGGDGNGSGNGDDDTGDGSGSGTEYGILSTSVTDQPNDIGDFESLVVTLDGIWVKPAGTDDEEEADGGDETDEDGDDETTSEDGDAMPEETATPDDEAEDEEDEGDETDEDDDDDEEEDDDDSGRRYIEFEEPQEADLVQLQGDETQLVDETELEVDEYQFLQMDVSDTTGTLTDGGEAVVETPGNAPLKFNQPFEIRAEETTRFIADFAPFQRGNGEYLVRPVASGTQVIYGDGDDSGESTETDDGIETETDPETPDADGDETDTDNGSGGNTAAPAN